MEKVEVDMQHKFEGAQVNDPAPYFFVKKILYFCRIFVKNHGKTMSIIRFYPSQWKCIPSIL